MLDTKRAKTLARPGERSSGWSREVFTHLRSLVVESAQKGQAIIRSARRRRRAYTSVPTAVGQFAVSGLVVVVLIVVADAFVLSRLGNSEAIRDARTVTRIMGKGIIEPNLTDALVAGDPEAVAQMDIIVRDQILESPVVRVKLWTAGGRIVYSDDARNIGQTYPLGKEEAVALAMGQVVAEKLGDFSNPENRFDRGLGDLLEVYLPVKTPSGRPLLFETYQEFDAVTSGGRQVWRAFAPTVLAAIVVLWLLQVPLAWSMGRRLQTGRQEREALLRRAVDASSSERRRIAAGLHDGIVQDLTGLSLSLTAAENKARYVGQPALAEEMNRAALSTRDSVRQMRTLLLEIYPPNLHGVGLESALLDLLAPYAARGIDCRAEIQPGLSLDPETETLIFRIAQEALRNVSSHSGARHVTLEVVDTGVGVTLVVQDDGLGFEPAEAERQLAKGHMGLHLLRELAAAAGGRLEVSSTLGRGTRLAFQVPST